MSEQPSEYLPEPDVDLPEGRIPMADAMQTATARYLAQIVRSHDNWDIQRGLRQSKANLNYLLDHWPNGTPRDHIAMYEYHDAISTPLPDLTPDNIIMGQE